MPGIEMASYSSALYYAAAAATALAGVLHLTLGPGSLGFSVANGILFTVGGIAQVFWIMTVVRRWGRVWYVVGIAGTVAFIAIWAITRMPGNPITGRGSPVNLLAVVTEASQAAFIGLLAAILVYEGSSTKANAAAKNKSRNNRQILVLASIVVVIVLAGSFVSLSMGRPSGLPPGQHRASQTVADTAEQTCTLTPSLVEVEDTPQQIEGPYFVDEKLERSDLRPDPSDGSVQESIPLRLVLNVYDVDDSSFCIPLRHAQVDIWQANALGLYSDIQSIGTGGKKFLRGYQLTDDNGTARFTTVYPGWYEGRALHIHVKVRTFEGAEKTFEWTPQLYLNDSISDSV